MRAHSDFVHLHCHTEYSLLDGLLRINDMVRKAAQYRMPALAITDHGNIFGAVEFFKKAQESGLKPLIGCEVYMAKNSRFEKEGSKESSPYHLILLCLDKAGYKNLCQLLTLSYLEGFYRKPRIDLELLTKHHQGLIALSACLQGEIPSLLLKGDERSAKRRANEYKELFGKDNFYLELQSNGLAEQVKVNAKLVRLSEESGIPLVATNDCHYLSKEDYRLQEVVLCINQNKRIDDPDRFRFNTNELYFRSPSEMKELFREVPDAIKNTVEIAKRISFEFEFNRFHFPQFELEDSATIEEIFEREARRGFEERIKELSKEPGFREREKIYRDRFEYELNIIKRMGFSAYFLIVSDFIKFARKNNIAVGPGRGSAAGSLVSYSLGISDLDPIRYGLIFERFLNPERVEMPDIDVDFCMERRAEVIKYVTEKYGGSKKVVQLITFQKMKTRAAIRDVGRILNLPRELVDRIAKLIPEHMERTEETERAEERSTGIEEALKQVPILQEEREKDKRVAQLLDIVKAIEGLNRNVSTHAAGLVISDKEITEYMPLYKGAKDQEPVVTQFDMDSVKEIGIIKFDLLGLRTLTMIEEIKKLVKVNYGVEIELNKLPLDDKKVFDLISQGHTAGLFQLESQGMTELGMRLKPERFEELIAQIALFRPGPMRMIEDYIERKNKKKAVSYLLPELEEILKETYGVILYQEQVLQIVYKLAGYTMGEAEKFRRAMGKKKYEVMEAEREPFIKRCRERGVDGRKAEEIFNLVSEFAGYGFNKAHSTAYALIAYWTAYLKAHYPLEFMASLLSSVMDNTDKVVAYLKECDKLNIEIVPPHINISGYKFNVLNGKIVYGLGAIKNVGEQAVDAIVEARREGGPFCSIFDFCERVDLRRVNRRVIESLIKASAFDGLGASRAQLCAVIEEGIEAGGAFQRSREIGQASMLSLMAKKDELEKRDSQRLPQIEEWDRSTILAYEFEVLGFYLSGHPLLKYEKIFRALGVSDGSKLRTLQSGTMVLIGGLINKVRETKTQSKGERMGFITVGDLTSNIEVIAFPSVFKDSLSYLKEKNSVILVRGRVKQEQDQFKVVADDIFPLEDIFNRLNFKLHFWLSDMNVKEEKLLKLKELFLNKPGNTKVIMHISIPQESEVVISLPSNYQVKPDFEFIEELETLFGPGCLRIEQ